MLKVQLYASLWKSRGEGILDFITEAGLLFLCTDVDGVLNAKQAARRGRSTLNRSSAYAHFLITPRQKERKKKKGKTRD